MAASWLILAALCANFVQVTGQCENCGFLGLGESSLRNTTFVFEAISYEVILHCLHEPITSTSYTLSPGHWEVCLHPASYISH